MSDAYIYTHQGGGCMQSSTAFPLRCYLNSKMQLHPIVSFLVGVILDLLQLKFSGNGNGNGNQGDVSSDDSSTSPLNTHPMIILLGVLWLLVYSWLALAASTTATATSSPSPTSDSPPNRDVAASHLSAATIFPSASSPAPATSSNTLPSSVKMAGAETPLSSVSAAASCSLSPAQAASSNAFSSYVKMAMAETPLSSASAAASCPSSPALATPSDSLSSAVAETVLSAASCPSSLAPVTSSSAVAETVLSAGSCSSPAATCNPSLLAQRSATVVIMIPTSSPTVAVSATSSPWISMILGKINYPASKLLARIKCPPEQLMLMFASMAISTFGCLLFPTPAQYRVLYTSYALIIGFNVIFLRPLPRQGNISPV